MSEDFDKDLATSLQESQGFIWKNETLDTGDYKLKLLVGDS
jgi:hypothetical protein